MSLIGEPNEEQNELNNKEQHAFEVNNQLLATTEKFKDLLDIIASTEPHDKRSVVNRYNSRVRKLKNDDDHMGGLLFLNPYTFKPEWKQYYKNSIAIQQLTSIHNGTPAERYNRQTLSLDIDAYRNTKSRMTPTHRVKMAKEYNKCVAYLRHHGYPDLLILNRETYEYNLIAPVAAGPPQIKPCAITGDIPEVNFVSLHLSRRQSIRCDTREEIFIALRAALDSSSVKLISPSDTPPNTKKKSAYTCGTVKGYHLSIPFKILNSEGVLIPTSILSNSKNIQYALVPHGTFVDSMKHPLVELNPTRFNIFVDFQKLVNRKIVNLIHANPSHGIKVFFCNKPACPCENGFMVTIDGHVKKVFCEICPREFCYDCGDMYHGDFDCAMPIDEMSSLLISQTTQPCPNCSVAIEKNEGCNHMTCKHCTQNWCWICNEMFPSTDPYHPPLVGCPVLARRAALEDPDNW